MNNNITRIALVDDHVLLRNGLASLIQSFEGYIVLFQADNGKEFIQQLKTNPLPDIILLDITMPEMNGFETAAWIKQNAPSIKILVLSMMDNDEVVISMLKAGARGYILKDNKPAVFKQALDNIRDTGFFMNDLVSNKMLSYVKDEESKGKGMSATEVLFKFVDKQAFAEALEDAILACDYWGLLPRDERGQIIDQPSAVGVIDRDESIGLLEYDEYDGSTIEAHQITREKFAQGVIRLAVTRFMDNIDSADADAALQLGLLDEIRYG